ncbi:hypothetical protein BKA82DRAFT_4072573, partial [Pisolithus tinctorius]
VRPPCTSFLLSTMYVISFLCRARTLIWYRHQLGHSVSRVTSCTLLPHFDRCWNARFPCVQTWPCTCLFFSPSSRHT